MYCNRCCDCDCDCDCEEVDAGDTEEEERDGVEDVEDVHDADEDTNGTDDVPVRDDEAWSDRLRSSKMLPIFGGDTKSCTAKETDGDADAEAMGTSELSIKLDSSDDPDAALKSSSSL